jgi:hypothetical protein
VKKDTRWDEMIKIVQETQVLANSFELKGVDRDTSFNYDLLLRSVLALMENSYVDDSGQRDYLFKTLLPACQKVAKETHIDRRVDLIFEAYYN